MDTFLTILAIGILFLGLPVGLLLLADWRRRRQEARLLDATAGVDMALPFCVEFTSTTQDLLDAHAAYTSMNDPVRPALRVFFLGFGVLWASAPVWVFVLKTEKPGLHSLIMWLSGCAILWGSLLRPRLERRRIARESLTPQRLDIEFRESGIAMRSTGGEEFERGWKEVESARVCRKGLLLSFADGTVNLLPRRVFSGDDEMAALRVVVEGRLRRTDSPTLPELK